MFSHDRVGFTTARLPIGKNGGVETFQTVHGEVLPHRLKDLLLLSGWVEDSVVSEFTTGVRRIGGGRDQQRFGIGLNGQATGGSFTGNLWPHTDEHFDVVAHGVTQISG